MRVGFVTTTGSVAWGGSEGLWAGAAMALLRDGHSVDVHCFWFPETPPTLHSLMDRGARVYRAKPLTRMAKLARRVLPSSPYRWLDRNPLDLVVISQSCLDGVHWGEACRQRGIPYAFITQVVAEFFWPQDREADLAATVLDGAKRCYFVSRGNLELTQRQLGVRLGNWEFVWNPFTVPHDIDLPWPSADELKLACVARLDSRHKGHDLLIECLAQPVWKQRAVSLDIYGAGPNERALRRLVEMHALDSVQFRGHCRDIVGVWRDHHVLVLASRVEGMPLAAIETMLCGRVCVLTDVGGNAELIEDSVTGFIARFPSSSEVSRALENLWNARHRLAQIGQAAKIRARMVVPIDPGRDLARRLVEI